MPVHCNMPQIKPTTPARMYLPSTISQVTADDAEFYQQHIKGFVPPDVFDVHAHLYTIPGIKLPLETSDPEAESVLDFDLYQNTLAAWMGDDAPADGLFFAAPITRRVDTDIENRFVRREVAARPGSSCLMLVRPNADPDAVERELLKHGDAGFKVYHLLADVPADVQTFDLPSESFLPDWVWAIADRHELAIMLHMVRPRALADPMNQDYIRQRCERYPGARLILAHAARGFCGRHTVEGIHSLVGLDNVFFDTSAICEPDAFHAILKTIGPTRLMFGTDWPVSNTRGRCVSVGDGFFWMHEHNTDFASQPFGRPTLVGNESLLALRDAARTVQLNTRGIEQLFHDNARALLKQPTATR